MKNQYSDLDKMYFFGAHPTSCINHAHFLILIRKLMQLNHLAYISSLDLSSIDQ